MSLTKACVDQWVGTIKIKLNWEREIERDRDKERGYLSTISNMYDMSENIAW